MQVKEKKSLGQHFLINQAAIDGIIRLGGISDSSDVVEIGPGPGALTEPLCGMKWKSLLLIEKDDAFAELHGRKNIPGLSVWHGDALQFAWESLAKGTILLGNLPYNVASPMIWDIVLRMPKMKRAVFMVQKEVAERIRAAAGGKTYGALGAWVQNFCSVQKGFVLGPASFSPPPKVDSEVIVLTPLEDRPSDPDRLASTIKACFSQRRKQLGTILKSTMPDAYAPEKLARCGLTSDIRPEKLTPMQFRDLAASLFAAR